MATETNNSDQQTENTMTTDSNHPDPKSESTMNPDDVDTNQNAKESEGIDTGGMIEQCRLEIVEAWGGSVEAVIKTGKIIIKAKAELGGSFTQLEEVLVTLGFKRTVLSYLCTISNNPVLSLPENRCRLPSAYNTLYQLTFVPEDKLAELIKDGTVTPSTTLEEAKLLRPWPTRSVVHEPEDEGIPLALKSLAPESRELFFEELSTVAKSKRSTVPR